MPEEQVLEEQVVLQGVAEEDRPVDVGVVERPGVRLVLQQGGALDVEHLERHPDRRPEPYVGAGVGRAVGEADQRPMAPGGGVDALGVLGRKTVQDLDLAPDDAVPLGVCVANRTTGRDRPGDVVLRLVDDDLDVLVEPGLRHLDVRRVGNET
jgi:hypothetical protein